MSETKIITAASEKYASSLFALIGSLNCNYPSHPPVVVYDIGLEEKSLAFLKYAGIEVRSVPPFCEHWRRHYTWKIWCINDIQTENVIWIDAGLCVLNNLDDIIQEIDKNGYFLVKSDQLLDWEASKESCEGCGVDYSFRLGKFTFGGGLFGAKKQGIIKNILLEALNVVLDENTIKEGIMGSTYKYPQFLAVVWNDKGFAFFQLNNYQEAIKCYLKALEINPNFIKALNNKKNAENALIELKNIICPQCGSENPQESEYCINCGRQLKIKKDSKKCSNCGFENLEVAEFCIECGKKFISTENNYFCPKCNTQINSETKFCPECGNKIEQINNNKICPKCNSTIDKDVKFCPECGENLKISRA